MRRIKSKKLIHLVCFCMIFLCACSGENVSKEKKTVKLPSSEYAMTKVEFPFDNTRLNFKNSAVHDDFMDIFLMENDQMRWYVYDMQSETWEEKEIQWEGKTYFDTNGKPRYDSKGNRYFLLTTESGEDAKYDIYKLNDDGTFECYLKFTDYIPDYKKISGGWKFMEDDRILVSLDYEDTEKATEVFIIDPLKQEKQQTYMENIFSFNNVLLDGSLYIYPCENEDSELIVRVGDLWDYKKKQEIHSNIELDFDLDPTAEILPLLKEEDNYYSVTRYGIYKFTLQKAEVECMVPAEVVQEELTKYGSYTAAYKSQGEDKFYVLAQDGFKIGLYKIE